MKESRPIIYSAPISIIFNGFHTMLYGNPAFGVSTTEVAVIHLQEKKGDIPNELKELDIFIKKYLKKKKRFIKDVSYTYSLNVPDYYNHIHSPTIVALLVAAISELYMGEPLVIAEINALAFQYLKDKKIDIYGLNSSTATIGGLIYYRKEFEFLKGIYQLPFHIPSPFLEHISLIFSPLSNPLTPIPFKKLGKKLDILEKITKRFIISIVKEDMNYFKEQITEQNELLLSLNTFSEEAIALDASLKDNKQGMVIDEFSDSTHHYSIVWHEDRNGIKSIKIKKDMYIIALKQSSRGLQKIIAEE